MLSLRELETAFGDWLLRGTASPELFALVDGDGWAVEDRLDLHRNNLFASLTKALSATFPATARLVGDGFFAYAAHEFIAAQPPRAACLAEYGAGFADFLAAFPPCHALPYLPDVARLEWLMHRAGEAEALPPLAAAALADVAEEDGPRLVLRLQPSIAHLRSPYPIDRIWDANHACAAEEDGEIDLAAGGVALEIGRVAQDVVYRRLDPASFVFRAALAAGTPLGQAAEAALAENSAFDLAQALPALFQEGAVIDAALAADTDQERTS